VSAALAAGEILAGKYRIERVLGQGGMGVVLSATHLQLGQRVAIKLLLEGATNEVVQRFLREARASVRLKSEHVARVIDVGELPSGAPFMVMEYLEGNDLSQVVRGSGARPIPEAVEHLLHACEAIAEAHAAGIVHRDLKPANLFLTRAADGTATVKVLDFGISKAQTGEAGQEDEGMALTKTTAVLGSPLYMSPEQMKAARFADARSDIWSLGAILYELLTGRVPFNTTTFTELVLMVNMEQPPPIAQTRPDVPPALAAAVMRCLEKKPENRFQNVAELAYAIVDFGPPGAAASAERVARTLEASGLASTGARSMRLPPTADRTAASLTALSSTAAAPPSGSRSTMLIAGAAALLAIGGAAAFFALGKKGPEGAATAAIPPIVSVEPKPAAPAMPTAAEPAAPSAAAPVVSAVAPVASVAAVAAVAPAVLPRSGPLPKATAAAATPPPVTPPGKKNPLDIQIK
jgi:eukaryotic-like serine/threonine-protein kinase